MSCPKTACICILACVFGGAALAAHYPVVCADPAGAGIQAAVTTIASTLPNGPNTISVSGTCHEKVIITSLKNLTIYGASEATDGIMSTDDLPAAVVNITDSFNIKIRNLTLNGNGVAGLVGANASQQVEIRNVTLRNGSAGLICSNGALCMINMQGGDTTTFTALSGPAVQAWTNARVNFGNWATQIYITDTRGGIDARLNSQVIVGGRWTITTQRENAAGIAVDSSIITTQSCGASGVSNTISGASTGIGVFHNGYYQSSCPLTLENNKTAVAVTMSSALRLEGATGTVVIRNNADSGEPRRTGGVIVSEGSAAIVGGAEVTGNQKAGILVANNSMLTLTNSTITGNLGDGVLVTQRAALYLPIASSWGANTGKDLVCSVQGTAYGNSSGIAKKRMDCKAFEEMP